MIDSFALLYLPVTLASIADQEKVKKGMAPHDNLVKNVLIKQISDHSGIENVYLKSGLQWDQEREEVRQWFKEIIAKDDDYVNYLSKEAPTFEEDRDIVLYILKTLVFKSDAFTLFMEQQDLYWSENKAIVKSLLLKTIKGTETDNPDFELAEISYNWEEDKEFFERMYDDTLDEENKYEELIDEKAKNWDIERIATTDRILLKMAIQEMVNFPSIPVKVTINEYIEISKKIQYS